VDTYATTLSPEAFQPVAYPTREGQRIVYDHVLASRIKKLYR
jgi:hypothetical protein